MNILRVENARGSCGSKRGNEAVDGIRSFSEQKNIVEWGLMGHKRNPLDMFALSDLVRETGFAIHCYHRHGHLEKVYENALAHRLRKKGIPVIQQHPVPVFDEDGTPLGDYFADLFVAECLIVEVKAVRHVLDEHTAQLLGYLRSSKIEHGVLINFGGTKFGIRKYVLSDALTEGSGFTL